MPLNSKGGVARVWEVYKSTLDYQLVQIYTYKKNPPTAEKKFSMDFTEVVALRNNRTVVKKGDLIEYHAFTVGGGFYKKTKGRTIFINITDWELKGAYDYSNLNKIEYKGADYEEDEE